uniref:Uncharacterized protein n=1 Tax=Heterorhabditis bacteriophora TaxID=37862 RepID=A0A1I7X609_HETBA
MKVLFRFMAPNADEVTASTWEPQSTIVLEKFARSGSLVDCQLFGMRRPSRDAGTVISVGRKTRQVMPTVTVSLHFLDLELLTYFANVFISFHNRNLYNKIRYFFTLQMSFMQQGLVLLPRKENARLVNNTF